MIMNKIKLFIVSLTLALLATKAHAGIPFYLESKNNTSATNWNTQTYSHEARVGVAYPWVYAEVGKGRQYVNSFNKGQNMDTFEVGSKITIKKVDVKLKFEGSNGKRLNSKLPQKFLDTGGEVRIRYNF
jgi:hypothetical protein